MSYYAPAGLMGVGVPQANPTVEAELRLLLPPAVGLLGARLVSAAAAPDQRLMEYARNLPSLPEHFGGAPLLAIGFACTGSSYLVGTQREAQLTVAAAARTGIPVITATAAVAEALATLGVRRIALVTPYPPRLNDAAVSYWQRRGFELARQHRIDLPGTDTRGIYALDGDAASSAIAALAASDLDAVLISGTGLPSLPAILAGSAAGVPMLSSNLCLAWAMLRAAGITPPVGPESPLLGGWADRLSALQRSVLPV